MAKKAVFHAATVLLPITSGGQFLIILSTFFPFERLIIVKTGLLFCGFVVGR